MMRLLVIFVGAFGGVQIGLHAPGPYALLGPAALLLTVLWMRATEKR